MNTLVRTQVINGFAMIFWMPPLSLGAWWLAVSFRSCSRRVRSEDPKLEDIQSFWWLNLGFFCSALLIHVLAMFALEGNAIARWFTVPAGIGVVLSVIALCFPTKRPETPDEPPARRDADIIDSSRNSRKETL